MQAGILILDNMAFARPPPILKEPVMTSFRLAPPLSAYRRGFTMIEVLVVVAIVGILSAIAIPSYTSYLKRSTRSAAQLHLLDIAHSQQQYLADNRAYAATVAALGLTTPAKVSDNYIISLSVDAGPPATFTATATAKGNQLSDGNLSINSAGAKTPEANW